MLDKIHLHPLFSIYKVYLAHDSKLDRDRQIALKTLPSAFAADPQRLARFQTEAKAAARLNHPNIATLYDLEEVDGTHFITMEYVEGQPLKELIPKDGLALDTFFAWFIPLADALTHAHEKGVTHRDIKPGNIMVTPEGVPKILDFGLARITRPEPEEADSMAPTVSLTQGGAVLGTPLYMSPEQAEGKEVDGRSDVFSFGVVMYEALIGDRPFKGVTYVSVISSILKDEPEAVTNLKIDLPYLLGRIVRHSLEKDLGRRTQAMLEIRRDLEEVKAEMDTGVIVGDIGTTAAPVPAATPWWRQPVAMAVVALALTIGLTAAWLLKPIPESPLRKFRLPGPTTLGPNLAIAPNGRMVAYTQNGRLWLRDLDQLDGHELPGTDNAAILFWSPGSDYVGYTVELRVVGQVDLVY